MKVYDGSENAGAEGSTVDRRTVGIAEYEVTTDGASLTTSGLGSCIGVALLDESEGVAGLVHVMLPSSEEGEADRAKFADTGVEALIEAMQERGATRRDMTAKIAGGSDMLDFSSTGDSIGSRNAAVVKETLGEFDIPIEGSDIGGDHGRSLCLETSTGDLVVKNANQESSRL
jgi:chemotaxis protein CheD